VAHPEAPEPKPRRRPTAASNFGAGRRESHDATAFYAQVAHGEVVGRKSEGATGSCARGSFRSAATPVSRDTTERVVSASKGRFDRAPSRADRERRGLPSVDTIDADELMAATLDVCDIEPESARRAAPALAEQVLANPGFEIVAKNTRPAGTGVTINFIATDAVEKRSTEGCAHLRKYAEGGHSEGPTAGFLASWPT
jgi:hypothetical protein